MSSKRALIVDDSRSARAFLARLLERQGLEVDGVGSASEAYAYLRRQLPDVLFLDHLMPEADGFDVLRVLKKDTRTRAIPVLMYTSQQGDDYLAQARALGAVGVLPKQLRALDVTNALDQLGMRPDPAAAQQSEQRTAAQHGVTQQGATQPFPQATTVVDPRAPRQPAPPPLQPTLATTVIDAGAPRAGALAARAALAAAAGAGSGVGDAVSPELRSLLEALVREQGLAVRQQVAQLVTQQGERMANELRAIRREVGDMNERLAAGANAIAITGAHRAREPAATTGRRALLWVGLVLAVITAAVGATWLLRPDLWSNAPADAAHPAAAAPALAIRPAGAAGPGGAADAATPSGTTPPAAAPLFAAPEPPPRGMPAPAVDPAAHAATPETGAGGAAGEPAPGTP